MARVAKTNGALRVEHRKGSETWKPDEWLEQVLPDFFFDKPITQGGAKTLSLERTAFVAIATALQETTVRGDGGVNIKKRQVNAMVDDVLSGYKERMRGLPTNKMREALNLEAELKNAVKQTLLRFESRAQQLLNEGKYYEWLPSEAKVPDDYHQTLYGNVYRAGEGDRDGHPPAERYGCQCGVRWIAKSEAEALGLDTSGYEE